MKTTQNRMLGLLVAMLLMAASSGASVSLLLEQPYGKLGVIDPTGHSAVYFDHICAETPTKVRPCKPGELGVVVSRYDDVGGYDWIAVPLIPYLYGVASADQIPESVDHAEAFRIRDAYRRKYLEAVAPDRIDGSAPENNWTELMGSAFDRTIYGFRVKTTPEQDAAMIARLNDSRNIQRYNGMFVNCADFVRTTIDHLYPHAIRRNFVADWGMTSPKSAARALAHYAGRHPEIEYSTFVVPQVAGLRRSREVCTGAECLMKQYGIAVAIVSPWTAGIEFASYLTFGRFAMPKDAPKLDVRAMELAAGPVAPEPVLADVVGGGMDAEPDRVRALSRRSVGVTYLRR